MRPRGYFSAGPGALPAPVLDRARAELLDYDGRGISMLEMSHRDPRFELVLARAEQRLLRLLGLGADYRALFVQGGGSQQFAMVPLNLLPPGGSADYLVTGAWGAKALAEARRVGRVHATTTGPAYREVMAGDALQAALDPDATYVHLTSNETIGGVQWATLPDTGAVPLVVDASSDILTRPLGPRPPALLYASAQKNLGPAGVTAIVVRQDLLARPLPDAVPEVFRYAAHAAADSLYHTPPVFAVYLLELVLAWIEDAGGVPAMAARSVAKAAALYDAIDRSGGFYVGHADPGSRSLTNVVFGLADPSREAALIAAAEEEGLFGLAGHRSLGGLRVSLYTAVPVEAAVALGEFLTAFAERYAS